MAGQNQGGGSVDLFDAYFRRADLDQDGRISGAESVDFFQGSNLSQQVLAQIWMHADHSLTGFLGRLEFYNALKLVTVAQSKQDLTPDMVKAALYSPASAKIPAPKINLAATPAPQVISSPSAPVPQVNLMPPSLPQMGAVAQMPSQNFGFRGQVPPNSGMSQEYFPSQGNQLNRPPVPMPSGTGLRPPQGVSGPNLPGAGSTLSSSNLSTDWFGARTGGAPTGATSQVPNRGISPSIPSAGQKPPDPLSTSSLMAAKDPKYSVGSGNGLVSNSLFGGDMFSVNQFVPKQASSAATYSASSAPASSAIVSMTSGSQPSPKLDPLVSLSAFTRQSTGGHVPPTQSVSAQSNTSLGSSRVSLDAGNSTSSQPQSLWPKMTQVGIQRYHKVFVEVDTDRDGKITEVLKQVWDLSDQDNDIMLSLREFCVALYLMERYREGQPLPETLPNSIILDQTLLSLAGPPNASYETATWGSSPGLRPGMPGAPPMTPAGLRPPAQAGFPQPDGTMQFNHQKARSPLMENSQATQLSNGEHNSTDLNFEAESETDNKVGNKEKMILDSKEKMVFYREKMQDLVLFKSRCDNRLNEITERAIADKHEAELLGKKYEEKYKQVTEIASKLTIEEASFRDIQERKMEYHQAIIKMEQGGSADGILQVRADRIQSDLEELLKALTERCKKHGVHVKSAALVELPHGWQPGIPEVSAVWNEEWDKFDEEGFSFDVAVPTDAVSPRKELFSPTNSFSPDSFSNADDKSEKPFNKVEHTVETESAYSHSEDESMRSPKGSPVRQPAFESPSHDYSDDHSRKSFEAETETQRSFDEPVWGTFDNNVGTDSVWGFSSMNVKESDHEKHGEKYFFESSDFGGSPVRTGSPQADSHSMFPKKSSFTFEDSVPNSPLSRAGNSPPRYTGGSGDQFFNNMSRFDSFSTQDHDFSSRRETFTRFDSINSTSGFDHSRGFSFDDSDPFGSRGPFKVSSESETPKRGSDCWNAF